MLILLVVYIFYKGPPHLIRRKNISPPYAAKTEIHDFFAKYNIRDIKKEVLFVDSSIWQIFLVYDRKDSFDF